MKDAAYWYQYLSQKYPDKPILDNKPDSLPATVSLDQYVVLRVTEDVNETSKDRVQASVEGMLINAYAALIQGEDDRYEGFKLLAQKIWTAYMTKIPEERIAADRITSN